jgi:hypothetical protein
MMFGKCLREAIVNGRRQTQTQLGIMLHTWVQEQFVKKYSQIKEKHIWMQVQIGLHF